MIKQYIVKDDLTLIDAKEIDIYKMLHQLINQTPQQATDDEIFIGLKELCQRLSVAKQSIYNQINTGILVEGLHFFKPTGGKLLFKWSAMLEWVESQGGKQPNKTTTASEESVHLQSLNRPSPPKTHSIKTLINI